MKDRKEILMDAIGKVNEKYIENSMSKDKAPSLLIDDYITSQSGNAYEVKPVPMPEKRKFPVKTAVFTGIAAALMITAAGVVINRLGADKITTGSASVTTAVTTAPPDITTAAVTTTSDLGSASNPYYLRDMYPMYFNCSTFKGLEVYADRNAAGEWQFRLMSGTDMIKTEEQIYSLPPVGAEEMRTVLAWYRKQETEPLYVFVLDAATGEELNDPEVTAMLGITEPDAVIMPDDAPVLTTAAESSAYDTGGDVPPLPAVTETSAYDTLVPPPEEAATEEAAPEEAVTVDDTTAVMNYNEFVNAAFEIQEQRFYSSEPNPGENFPAYGVTVTGGKAYSMETFEISADSFLKDIEGMGFSDRFMQVIKPYCDGDRLDPGMMTADTAGVTSAVGLMDNEPRAGRYYLLGEYLLGTFDDGMSFCVYRYSEKYTALRKIIETLWREYYGGFEGDIAAALVMDWGKGEEYLKIITGEENTGKIRELLTDAAPDTEGLYRIVTRETEQNSWLPITNITHNKDNTEIYSYPLTQTDVYNIAFDSGVYSGVISYSLSEYGEIADRLAELGAGDAAERFRSDAAKVHADGWSFEWLTPYDSIFDLVKLGQNTNVYLKITDDIIIEQIAADKNDPDPEMRILTKEPQLTALRSAVIYFRSFPSLDFKESSFRQYTGERLIVDWDYMKTPGSSEPNATFTFIAETSDPEMQNSYDEWRAAVSEYICGWAGIPDDRLTVTSDPVDFGDIPVHEPF